MAYIRPKPTKKLTPPQRRDVLDATVQAASSDSLNRKIPRKLFEKSLDKIGEQLLLLARDVASSDMAVRAFLDENPLPPLMRDLIPTEYRVFCLLLNALKQWVTKEQLATDSYVLGSSARADLKKALTTCPVTGKGVLLEEIELHHTVRDGRPPIPLSKTGHALLERQSKGESGADDDRADGSDSAEVVNALKNVIRVENKSWVHLRRGCHDLLGRAVTHSSKGMQSSARSLAKKAINTTGKSADEILAVLDTHGRGSGEV